MIRIWLSITLMFYALSTRAQTLDGVWQATLEGNPPHRLILQLIKKSDGSWGRALYRIDQSGEPESIPSLIISGSDIHLAFTDGTTYNGKLNPSASTLQGTWIAPTHPPQPINFQRATKETAWEDLNSNAAPPPTTNDLKIIQHAEAILNSPAKWNRADNRHCPTAATTFSLYCALDRATVEVEGQFQHRGAAMQQARFVIDDNLAKGNHYHHRLMDYNNDPNTTFADTQTFFNLLAQRIQKQLEQAHADQPRY